MNLMEDKCGTDAGCLDDLYYSLQDQILADPAGDKFYLSFAMQH